MTIGATAQFKRFWAHVGLLDLSLTAPSAAGLVPNCPGAAGFDAAPIPTTFRLNESAYGDRAERGKPLRMVGCRNGAFSGQIVVSSDRPFDGQKVACTDLKAVEGASVIPAAALELRYPRAEWVNGIYGSVFGFDALEEEAPSAVSVISYEVGRDRQKIVGRAVQPVWLSVRVPKDAAAGTYSGTVTVSANGPTPVAIPVELRVIGWTMPDTKEWASFIDIIQSPDTLVETYKVALWSEEHWKLIDRSCGILGRVGNKTVWVPVIARTHLGNEQGMVRWIQKEGGGYDYDFAVMDRYLDTAIKHLGKVPVVEYLVWELAAGWQWSGADVRDKDAVQVSVLDPKTGAITLMKAPPFGTPEAREFWKPLYEALRQRMAKRGMTAAQMTGASFDRTPLKAALDDIHAVAPDFGWGFFGHPWMTKVWDKPCGYHTFVYHSWDGWDGEGQLTHKYGWKWEPGKIVGELCRPGSTGTGGQPLYDDCPLGQFRASSEYLVTSGVAGQGRIGGDFWACIDRQGRGFSAVWNRYPPNDWIHLTPTNSVSHLLGRGKKGTVPTVRFEMVRQGMQEVEARIFIEKALLDKALRAQLGEDLAGRAQKVLEDRNRALRAGCPDRDLDWGTYLAGVDARTAELYAAAAAVAEKLGSGK
jgi:hypothetical protein